MSTTSNSSIATTHNIICKRGDTFLRELKFWSDKAKTIPVDITANEFLMKVIGNGCSEPEILLFTMTDGFSITAPNILTLSKSADQMKKQAATYKFDLQQTSAGIVTTIIQGKFTIESDIA